MVVMRSRFLDPLERNRLDATVDVRVSERCDTSADILLSPPNFSNVKRFAPQGPSGHGDLSFPACCFCHGQGVA